MDEAKAGMGWNLKGSGASTGDALEAFSARLAPAGTKDKPGTAPHPMAGALTTAAEALLAVLPECKGGQVSVRTYGHTHDDGSSSVTVVIQCQPAGAERQTLTEADVGEVPAGVGP